MVVWPGETVSFFDTCGPCGAAEGYLNAGVVGGSGYGGSICQASTTLYGAVVRGPHHRGAPEPHDAFHVCAHRARCDGELGLFRLSLPQ